MSGDVQLWIGDADACPDPSRLVPVRNAPHPWYKPARGTAFWTSTWDAERRASGWTDWCEGQRPEWSDPSRTSRWLLTPDPDARVLVVDSLDDLRDVMCHYGLPTDYLDFARLDFEKMARDFDGMRVTEEGESETRFSDPSLYGWDCESTCWFRWCFVAVEPAPRLEPALCVTPKSNP